MPLSLGRRGTLGLSSGSYQHPGHLATQRGPVLLLGCHHSTGLGQPAGRGQEGARPTPWGNSLTSRFRAEQGEARGGFGGGDRTHFPHARHRRPGEGGPPHTTTRMRTHVSLQRPRPAHAPSLPAPCSLPWSKPIIMLRVATIISGVCLDNRHSSGQYLPALSDMSSR